MIKIKVYWFFAIADDVILVCSFNIHRAFRCCLDLQEGKNHQHKEKHVDFYWDLARFVWNNDWILDKLC